MSDAEKSLNDFLEGDSIELSYESAISLYPNSIIVIRSLDQSVNLKYVGSVTYIHNYNKIFRQERRISVRMPDYEKSVFISPIAVRPDEQFLNFYFDMKLKISTLGYKDMDSTFCYNYKPVIMDMGSFKNSSPKSMQNRWEVTVKIKHLPVGTPFVCGVMNKN
ncbi:hypothetical protein VQ643_07085 [Pseudomonas sp. F1_0610]|uniref:hypothetical protein n=1 Tax=Pseudomonas sp. F1_0610 TaxID=3114284 RepID=UPI0039C470A4